MNSCLLIIWEILFVDHMGILRRRGSHDVSKNTRQPSQNCSKCHDISGSILVPGGSANFPKGIVGFGRKFNNSQVGIMRYCSTSIAHFSGCYSAGFLKGCVERTWGSGGKLTTHCCPNMRNCSQCFKSQLTALGPTEEA